MVSSIFAQKLLVLTPIMEELDYLHLNVMVSSIFAQKLLILTPIMEELDYLPL
jgi:hypothetical protein